MERITKTHENFEDDDEDEESEQAKMRRQGQSLAEMWAQIAHEHETAEEEDEEEDDDEDDSKAKRASKLFRTLETPETDESAQENKVSKGAFTGMFEQTPVEEATAEVIDDHIDEEATTVAPEAVVTGTSQEAVGETTVETEPETVQQEMIQGKLEEDIPLIGESDDEQPEEVESSPDDSEQGFEQTEEEEEAIEEDDSSSTPPSTHPATPTSGSTTPPGTTLATPPTPPSPVSSGPAAPGGPGGFGGQTSGDTHVTNNYVDARRRSGLLPAIVSGVVVNKMSKNRDKILQEQIDKGDENRKELEETQVRVVDEAEKQKQRLQRGEQLSSAEIERRKVMDRDRLSREIADRAIQRRIEEERVNLLKNQSTDRQKTNEQNNIEQINIPEWRSRQLDLAREQQKGLDITEDIPSIIERPQGLVSEKARDLRLEQREGAENKKYDSIIDSNTNSTELLMPTVAENTTEVSQKQGSAPEQPIESFSLVDERDLYKKSIAAGAITALVVVGAIIVIALLAR